MDPSPVPAPARALAGVLAAAAAVLVLEVGGRLVPGALPAVVAVGDRVVDLAPPWLRDAGVRAVGTADKAVLLGSVAVVVAVLAAAAGLLAGRRALAGDAAVAALAGLALAAQLAAPGPDLLGPLLTSTLAGLVGAVLLRRLLRPPQVAGRPVSWDRRSFLLSAGLLGAAVVAGGGIVRSLDASASARRLRALVRLPAPARRAPGVVAAAELGVPGLSPVLTPTAGFYRIDTALRVPQIDVAGWSLRVDGDVERPLRLSYEELLSMPQVEADITLQCVSNRVGGPLVGTARWQGVLLADLLREAGVRAGADQVVGRSVDGFTTGFPTAVALDGRAALVAVGMNGEPLPAEHGYPARLVVPGLYGYVSATKWLQQVELTTLSGFDAYWVPRGWSKLGPVRTASRIDVPREYATIPAGDVVVAGVAWAPTRGIGLVEVQVDDGPWRRAELAAALGEDTWVQWQLPWRADPGRRVLRVRATDGDGLLQDALRRSPRPDGATGLHTVRIVVT